MGTGTEPATAQPSTPFSRELHRQSEFRTCKVRGCFCCIERQHTSSTTSVWCTLRQPQPSSVDQESLCANRACLMKAVSGFMKGAGRSAIRAEALVHVGELSAVRQALASAALAPGNDVTLAALKNPQRRPPCCGPTPERDSGSGARESLSARSRVVGPQHPKCDDGAAAL